MNDLKVILASLIIFTGIGFIAWFRVLKKRHEDFINPPRRMPKRAAFRPESYFEYSPERVEWKACAAKIQPAGSVECVAYSLRSLMQSPPLSLGEAVPTDIRTLFDLTSAYDDQKGEAGGLDPIGAMKYLQAKGFIGRRANFIGKFLRSFGFCHSFFNFKSAAQVAEFVRAYGPVISTIPVCDTPRIDENCLYRMDGTYQFGHSIFIYGVDQTRVCPDGTTGAFCVRWHYDWAGNTDGWLSFHLAESLLALNWTYGWRD